MASSRRSRAASALASSSALGPSAAARLRQQQARLQERQPRRHDEIVGGEFEAQLARRLDEGEVLVGQRQNGNLGEVHLLLPRQREQKIERALIAFDVDDQRRLIRSTLGAIGGDLERQDFCSHATGRLRPSW